MRFPRSLQKLVRPRYPVKYLSSHVVATLSLHLTLLEPHTWPALGGSNMGFLHGKLLGKNVMPP